MRRVVSSLVIVGLAGTLSVVVPDHASAAVLCMKKASGVVVARQACKSKETRLNLAQFEVVGAQGPQGSPGASGSTGPQGASGPQGPQGVAGPNGDLGQQGPQGDTGPQGAPGSQGDPGAQGPQGDAGTQGAPGPQGPQGDTGPQGPAGPQGDPGPSDAFAFSADGPVADLTTALGEIDNLPAGSYVISGKAWFTNSDDTDDVPLTCTLVADGTRLDESDVLVAASGTTAAPLSASSTFTDAVAALSVSCSDGGAGTVSANHVKITAIRVGTLH